MGAVYRAYHIPMDKPVAVKVQRRAQSDTEAVARFHRHARPRASDWIMRASFCVTDFGQTRRWSAVLVMELRR